MSVEARQATVYLVDDDAEVRGAIEFLLAAEDMPVRTFDRPDAMLAALGPEHRGCLLLDVRLPGMDGLELHQRLMANGVTMPALFISGHGDIPMAVRAVNAGAMDFLEKPFDDTALLARIARAFERDAEQARAALARAALRERLGSLTPRERDVLDGIVAGRLNKQIADELDISPRTVELHRGRVMEKLDAANAADLVRRVLSLEDD